MKCRQERLNLLRQKLNSPRVALLAEDVVVERVAAVALGAGGEEQAAVLALVTFDVKAPVKRHNSDGFFQSCEVILMM